VFKAFKVDIVWDGIVPQVNVNIVHLIVFSPFFCGSVF